MTEELQAEPAMTPQQELALYVAVETAERARQMMRRLSYGDWHAAYFNANRITGLFHDLHKDLGLGPGQGVRPYIQDMADYAFEARKAPCRINVGNAFKVAHNFCAAYRSRLQAAEISFYGFNYRPTTTEVVL